MRLANPPVNAEPMPSSEQTCRARDGTRLGYTLYGATAAADRIVLVHSLAMDRSFWRPVAETLAGRGAVYTIVAGTAAPTSRAGRKRSSFMPTISPT